MKILLIFPPLLGEERYGRLSRAGSYLPPLGLLYIAAVLEKTHDVRVIDGSVGRVSFSDILCQIGHWRPDIVGFSCFTSTYPKVTDLCSSIKQYHPQINIVLGGPHATACPGEVMAHTKADFIVVGEGEETIKELVQAIELNNDFSQVKGIFYRKNNQVVSTSPRPRITDLDRLPYPARHLLDMRLYKPSVMHFKKLPSFSIMCGRGCPFQCTFCSCAKVFKGKTIVRTPESIIEEVRFLQKNYEAQEVMFWDDTIGLKKEWMIRFCELLAPLNILWSCWIRVDLVSPDLLKLMAESGCWNVSYGVESGNQKVLDTIKKGFRVEQVRNAFQWTHEAGMEARGTFIFGLPNETKQSMQDTIQLAIDIRADYAQFQLLTPYPGTEMWDTLKNYGEVSNTDLSKYTIWFPVYTPRGLASADLSTTLRKAYSRFYLRPGYLWQRVRGLRSWDDLRRNMVGALSVMGMVRN